MPRKVTLSLAGLAALGLALMPGLASAEYRDLCDSSRVCEYTGPNAPVLDAAVCLDPTGEARLKNSAPCATGSVPFHVRFGEVVDPIALTVLAYIPLASACSIPGLCEENLDAPGGVGTAQGICCVNDVCWPGYDCGGTIFWCEDGVCNEDGTVTCFQSWEL